jgi:sigma-B regulation protein RsbU (phosphoserine phosphatase)
VSADGPALLVVDDNDDNRYTLTRRLTREGYTNLTTATNGREALDLSNRSGLTHSPRHHDARHERVRGTGAHEEAGAELRNLPVIMISARSEIESVVRCIELGAEDYLPKPFNPTLLRARIGASLEMKRLRDEVRASLARLGQEMDAARKLQLGMLPLVFPACTPAQPVEIHALMEPAREVGGDLYDFFYASEQLFCFHVGDVSGKGAAAAMLWRARAASSGWPCSSGGKSEAVRSRPCRLPRRSIVSFARTIAIACS